MSAARPLLSVVVPIHNEEEALPELQRRLAAVLDGLDGETEVVLVDDGSTDASAARIAEAALADPRFRGVKLSRNFGHQAAISAGLDLASGDAVVVMDGDLQHPPELIPELVARWREGYEVVYAIREDREGEPFVKRLTARVFYRLLGSLSSVDMPAFVGDFRLVDRQALNAFRSMRETNRYLRGMFAWIGFRQIGVPCPAAERVGGETKYTTGRMTKLATDALVSFSNVPLRLALLLGFLFAGLAFAGSVTALVLKLLGAYAVPGWASILVAVSFLGGMQLLVLGVIGAYVGRIYDEVKARPLYIVSDLVGFDEAPAASPRMIVTHEFPQR